MTSPNLNFFLDTTIQIDRRLEESQKIKNLEIVLTEAKTLSTSTYVKMEYRRSLVQDFVYLYTALSEEEDIGGVLQRIKSLSYKNQRRVSRMLGSVVKFFSDEKKEISESLGKKHGEMARYYFKTRIRFSMEDFDESIDSLINETDCYNAKKKPLFRGEKCDNRTIHCKPQNLKCKIVEFFIENINTFKNILEGLSKLQNLDDEQNRMKKILEKALRHPQNLSDYRNCWRCADSIIAVECPQDAILCTTNIKHFEPICEKIGKRLTAFKY